VPGQMPDQIMFRDPPVPYSRRHGATISPASALPIRRGRMARVTEGIALGDIRLPHMANRNDIVGRLTARPTADAATRVLHIRAVVAIAPRATAPPATAHPATARAVTVHLAIADVLTVVVVAATALRPADRRRTVAVAGPVVVLAAAVPADQAVGRATPEDIANRRSEIKVASLHAAPNRAAFFAPSGPAGLPTSGAPDINYATSCK